MKAKAVSLDFFRWSKSVLSLRGFYFFIFFGCCFFSFLDLAFERERERERGRSWKCVAGRQPIIFSLQSKHTWILVPNGKKKCKNTPIWWLGAFFFLFYKSYKKLVQDSIWNIWKTQWYNWKPWVVFAINPILRALALGNVNLILPFQKVTLLIILYHFTIHPTSQNSILPFYTLK